VEKHQLFVKDINETQKVELSYPIIADEKREVSVTYGMLDKASEPSGLPFTVRSVFIIDPSKKIRLIFTYPASCGRNFDEILRCVDSLQLTDSKRLFTPANWKKGDDVIIPPIIKDEEAKTLFGDFQTIKPYLRYVKQQQ